MLLLTNDLGDEKSKQSLCHRGAFTQKIWSRQQLVFLFSAIVFLPLHPPSIPQPGTAFFIPSLLHKPSCTTLNRSVFRSQGDAGSNGLQLYGIKANRTRLNLAVEVLWPEGIAGISGWAPNIGDITPLFTSPLCFKIP